VSYTYIMTSKPCKYYIGPLGFTSKVKCLKYTRNVIYTLGCCIIRSDHPEYIFFTNLLQNHPECDEKIGAGVDYFFIEPNALNIQYYGINIHRLDGTDIDFSWTYCCNFKPRTPRENLIKAMREAVKNYTSAYKKTHTRLICNFCKTEDEPYSKYHVDHDEISFKSLTDNFLKLWTKSVPVLFDSCEIYKLTIFKPIDVEFETSWVKYHNDNCSFQILCRSCNLSKPKTH
jgi:hypothetical protein